MKKAKHHFYLESKKNKNGEQLILLNFSYGFKEFNHEKNKFEPRPVKISSKWTITKKDWIGRPTYRANRSFSIKNGKELNTILKDMEDAAYEALSNYRLQHKKDPTPKELKHLILLALDRTKPTQTDKKISEYVSTLIKKRTELPKSSSEYWGEGSQRNYQNFKNHILKYESYSKSVMTFGDLTEEVYWSYFDCLNKLYHSETGEYYTVNNMAKECKNFKAILNCAVDDDIKIGFNFSKKKYKIHPIPSQKYEAFLTEEELKTIIDSNVSHSRELTHAKNYIIISSFTGLRIKDVINLHQVSLEKIDIIDEQFYIFTTKIRKTKKNLVDLIAIIPASKNLVDLYKSNDDNFPRFPSEPVLRRNITKLLKFLEFTKTRNITTYYYKADSKTIQKPFYEDFSPHNCRSTFITNMNLLGIMEGTIEPITHPTQKFKSTISIYDKSTLKDKAIKLINEVNSKQSKIYYFKPSIL